MDDTNIPMDPAAEPAPAMDGDVMETPATDETAPEAAPEVA